MALVLSRKESELLVLTLPDGRTIEVQVVRIQGERVRIGIEAPRDVKVLRGELRERAA